MNKSCNFCHGLLIAADLVGLRISIMKKTKKKREMFLVPKISLKQSVLRSKFDDGFANQKTKNIF